MKASRSARTIAVAGAAILFGGAAASVVSGHEARVRSQVGPLVPVVVAAQDIRAGKAITPDTAIEATGGAPRAGAIRPAAGAATAVARPSAFAPEWTLRGRLPD